MPLSAPDPKKFAGAILETEPIYPVDLLRVSRRATNEPWFGHSGGNRFDDPTQIYGTSYMGFNLAVAFAETVLHNEVADTSLPGFRLSPQDLLDRFVLHFDGGELKVAKLYGISLKKLGADGLLSTIEPYDIPQAWSQAVHAHGENVDGICYMSKHLNTERAIVLFERARSKLHVTKAIPFPDYPGAARALIDFGVLPAP